MDGDPRVEEIASRLGLPAGRMIAMSKTTYIRAHPGHAAFFNATLADADGNRLWWGDVDLTVSAEALSALARALGHPVLVVFEGDTWGGSIAIERAVAVFGPDGSVELPGSWFPLMWDRAGRIVRRIEPPLAGVEPTSLEVGAGADDIPTREEDDGP